MAESVKYDNTQVPEKCPYSNRYLKCPLLNPHKCAVKDAEFVTFITKFAVISRLSSPVFEFVQNLNNIHPNKKLMFLSEAWRILSEVKLARLYKVLAFFYDFSRVLQEGFEPKIQITDILCRDIRTVRTKYNNWVR